MAKVGSYSAYTGDLASTDYFYLLRSGQPSGSRDFKFQADQLQKQSTPGDALAGVTMAPGFLYSPDGSSLDFLGFLTASAALNFGSIAGAAQADLTITVTGAVVGDAVFLGLPSAPTAGIVFNGFVSAADTVTIRATNVTAGAIDPASATYRATVIKAS